MSGSLVVFMDATLARMTEHTSTWQRSRATASGRNQPPPHGRNLRTPR
jgi:hypothetical protein